MTPKPTPEQMRGLREKVKRERTPDDVMSPEDQQAAILEACGWKKKKYLVESITIDGCEQWMTSWWKNGVEYTANQLPDHLNDLNACHEMENVLTDKQWPEYRDHLRTVILSPVRMVSAWCKADLHATAAQRAEAFLKTLGLWRNS